MHKDLTNRKICQEDSLVKLCSMCGNISSHEKSFPTCKSNQYTCLNCMNYFLIIKKSRLYSEKCKYLLCSNTLDIKIDTKKINAI